MADSIFDATGFYRFEMDEGAIRTRQNARVMVLSDTAVATLVSTAVRAGDLRAVRTLGKILGEHASASLGGEVRDQTPEVLLSHAAGTLAVFGWGRLRLEQWGSALVTYVEDVPLLDEGQLALAALLGGLFSALSERDVACVPVDGERFLIVSPTIAEQVWTWAAEGAELAAIIDSLDTLEES
ncbi:MAG: hypothetical protein OEY14_04535 [Myxococcales bacterium]|nr:hypothetical protein [Myxococcales bacterium]